MGDDGRRGAWPILLVLLAVASVACSPTLTTPVATPVAAASSPATPEPTGPPKCVGEQRTEHAAVGWRGPRVVVLERTFDSCTGERERLLSVDPSAADWRSDSELGEPLPSDLQIRSDGTSVVVATPDGVRFLGAGDASRDLAKPPGGGAGWGGLGFAPVPGGGYLVIGTPELELVASDGSAIATSPLPPSYVAVAPTSDSHRFVIAPKEVLELPAGLVGTPFRASLWSTVSGTRTPLAENARYIRPSPDSLAYLWLGGGRTASLEADGSVVDRPIAGDPFMRSLDGTRFLSATTLADGTQNVELHDASDGSVLGSFRGAIGTPSWLGSTAAVVSGGDTGRESVVVIDGASVVWLPLP